MHLFLGEIYMFDAQLPIFPGVIPMKSAEPSHIPKPREEGLRAFGGRRGWGGGWSATPKVLWQFRSLEVSHGPSKKRKMIQKMRENIFRKAKHQAENLTFGVSFLLSLPVFC